MLFLILEAHPLAGSSSFCPSDVLSQATFLKHNCMWLENKSQGAVLSQFISPELWGGTKDFFSPQAYASTALKLTVVHDLSYLKIKTKPNQNKKNHQPINLIQINLTWIDCQGPPTLMEAVPNTVETKQSPCFCVLKSHYRKSGSFHSALKEKKEKQNKKPPNLFN